MTTLFYSPVDPARIATLEAEYPDLTEEARELLDAAVSEDLPAAIADGSLSLRLEEDGRYAFTFPVLLDGRGDTEAFLDRWDRYILKEEIPYVLTEVPKEALARLSSRYRRTVKMPLDDGETFFLVRAVTEIEELEESPTLVGTCVTLTPLDAGDAARYETLCTDPDVLRFYGYDMRADATEGTGGESLLGVAEREFATRRSLPLAIRRKGEFVGDILLYGFDAHGGASVAVRLLPDARGKGMASDALRTLLSYAEEVLGLICVTAEVREENIPSLRLFDHVMCRVGLCDGSVLYTSGKD